MDPVMGKRLEEALRKQVHRFRDIRENGYTLMGCSLCEISIDCEGCPFPATGTENVADERCMYAIFADYTGMEIIEKSYPGNPFYQYKRHKLGNGRRKWRRSALIRKHIDAVVEFYEQWLEKKIAPDVKFEYYTEKIVDKTEEPEERDDNIIT